MPLLSSTKNEQKARDPEMHQTRKGKQWYFGMKLHIGVDSQSGLAHSAMVTPANVHDKHSLPHLLHGQERRVYGDSAYASQKALIHGKAPKARAKNQGGCSPSRPEHLQIADTPQIQRLVQRSLRSHGLSQALAALLARRPAA